MNQRNTERKRLALLGACIFAITLIVGGCATHRTRDAVRSIQALSHLAAAPVIIVDEAKRRAELEQERRRTDVGRPDEMNGGENLRESKDQSFSAQSFSTQSQSLFHNHIDLHELIEEALDFVSAQYRGLSDENLACAIDIFSGIIADLISDDALARDPLYLEERIYDLEDCGLDLVSDYGQEIP
ncbi:MAG: hypothetical protein KDD64_03955 [Bdellovibrionales bacterium]|nr:hypothetical protein [Bdellovibrionales bacterium]